jgi:hypothetical protein
MKAIYDEWRNSRVRVDLQYVKSVVGGQRAGPIINMYKRWISRHEQFGDGNWVSEKIREKLETPRA